MRGLPLLSLLIFVPWLGAVLLVLLRRRISLSAARGLAVLFSLSSLLLSLPLLAHFDPATTAPQLVEHRAWIASLSVYYHLGLDGLSLVLVLLTGLIAPVAILASPLSPAHAATLPRLHAALLLLLQGSALGVFLALDFFHWFLFWELSLVPAFFLIKLWDGPGATRAAYQFFVYTIGGSAFLLLGFAALYAYTGTLDFATLARLAADGARWPAPIFFGILLGLAVKAPLWPFHTWQAPTYAAAPTGATMFLTAIMSKMGVYGFLRILWPIFPADLHAASGVLLWFALGGVVLGAFAALRQTELKRIFAYSSLNHVSYCLLALFAVSHATGTPLRTHEASTAALSGAILQIFNHGLSAAALFACVGVLESRRPGPPVTLADLGGIRATAPRFTLLCGFALFSSLGLPGLNGFVGEFLVFRGVFGLVPWAAATACLGLLITALFLLTFWQRVFHGPRRVDFSDITRMESAPLVPLVVLMILLGLAPGLLTALINPLVTTWAGHLTPP